MPRFLRASRSASLHKNSMSGTSENAQSETASETDRCCSCKSTRSSPGNFWFHAFQLVYRSPYHLTRAGPCSRCLRILDPSRGGGGASVAAALSLVPKMALRRSTSCCCLAAVGIWAGSYGMAATEGGTLLLVAGVEEGVVVGADAGREADEVKDRADRDRAREDDRRSEIMASPDCS